MLSYKFLNVPTSLQQFVSLVGIMHLKSDDQNTTSVYHYPWVNNTFLFIPLCDSPLILEANELYAQRSYRRAYFVWPKLIHEVGDFGIEHRALAIIFKPGVAQRLLHIPGKSILNLDIDATYVWGHSLPAVEMQLREAKTDAAMLTILENYLLQKIKVAKWESSFDMAIGELLKQNGNISVKHLAELAHKSTRQLERISMELLGMSPKLFARLTRFGVAYALKESGMNINWSQIAHHVGYFDQMHMIRDFKQFMGAMPKQTQQDEHSSLKVMSGFHGMA